MTGGEKRKLLLFVVLAAAALLVFRSNGFVGKPPSPARVAAPPPGDSGNTSARTRAGMAVAPGTVPDLPPVDAPLTSILEPLATRADAGDARAACRVAMELIRCANVDYYLSIAAFRSAANESEFEAKGDFDAADRAAEQELEQLRIASECRTVPSHLRDKGPHYLGQAARAGVPEAMVRYADAHFWPPDGRGVYADPEFDRWRRDAEGMLERALAAGVPEAPYILMLANQADFHGVSGLVRDDPVKAEALHQLMIRLHGWRERPTPGHLDALSLARARDMAKQWHEGPFRGRRYHGQERSLFQAAGFPRHDRAPHSFCTSDQPPSAE